MRKLLTILATLLLAALTASAQRTVTPTQPAASRLAVARTDRPQGPPPSVVHVHDEQGRTIMVDTITGKEWVDSTLLKIPKMQYPLLHALRVGVDIWDPLMRITGQKFGLAGISAALSLHNRYFPTLEFGMGVASDTPKEMNFTFRSPVAPYFRIGADYNIFYNNSPDYQLLVGLRYGFSAFRWSVDDVRVDNSYWEPAAGFSSGRQSTTAGWLEVCLGVKVKIVGPLSLGWTFKFHQMLHLSDNVLGKPMIIPGFGKRTGAVTGAFNIYYTFSLNEPVRTDSPEGAETSNP